LNSYCLSKYCEGNNVKTKGKAYGVGGVTMKEFEEKLTGNLYKIWNRLASGTYFPPAVREIEIPKKDEKMRKLGIPTVGDRIAQTVVKDTWKHR
jgi:RNA-directed DNA polymerase